MIADKFHSEGLLSGKSHSQKAAAAAAIHDELNLWVTEHFPFGSSAEMSEKSLRKGLKAVREKMSKMTEDECEEKYGVPIVLILSMIPTMLQFISAIWTWWKGETE